MHFEDADGEVLVIRRAFLNDDKELSKGRICFAQDVSVMVKYVLSLFMAVVLITLFWRKWLIK